MNVALTASRTLGAAVWHMLPALGYRAVLVSAPEGDNLHALASAAGVPAKTWRDPWPGALGADVLVAAHSFEIVPSAVLDALPAGAVGYHPSLLPRHPGRHAVEDTVAAGDRAAGGCVYRLTGDVDGGPLAASDSCRVLPGEDAAGLWRRALQPMGVALLARVLVDLRLGRVVWCEQFPEDGDWYGGLA